MRGKDQKETAWAKQWISVSLTNASFAIIKTYFWPTKSVAEVVDTGSFVNAGIVGVIVQVDTLVLRQEKKM